jgi:hypothetical protein
MLIETLLYVTFHVHIINAPRSVLQGSPAFQTLYTRSVRPASGFVLAR